jgi:hypothetical protein
MTLPAPDMSTLAPDMKNAGQDVSDVSDVSLRTMRASTLIWHNQLEVGGYGGDGEPRAPDASDASSDASNA